MLLLEASSWEWEQRPSWPSILAWVGLLRALREPLVV